MKKIAIGRNNACDIIIPDTSDLVSRKQAVLSVSFFGKMTLYDTSNNGTYVNGQVIETGKGVRVTRKDKVNFAKIIDLDWNEVKDPYKKEKLFTLLGAMVFLAVIVLVTVWCTTISSKEETTPAMEDVSMPIKGEVKTTVQPQAEQALPKAQPASPKRTRTTRKQKRKETQPLKINQTNDEAPILY